MLAAAVVPDFLLSALGRPRVLVVVCTALLAHPHRGSDSWIILVRLHSW